MPSIPDLASWRSRRPLAAAALTGSLVGVVVATLWSFARPDAPPAPVEAGGAASSTTASTAAPRVPGAKLRAVVDEVFDFVVTTRGVYPAGPVDVRLRDDAAFRAGLRERLSLDPEAPAATEATLVALRMADPGLDLAAAIEEALGEHVLGYWDHRADTLYLRGDDVGPRVRVTLAHELVHALQDQRLGLDDLLVGDDAEARAAVAALVEGDAELVATEYLRSLPFDDQATVLSGPSGLLAPGTPAGAPGRLDAVEAIVGFPYRHGPGLVAALVEEGGHDRVNAAFDDPPSTTEQVLHPERYLSREDGIDVAAPEPESAGRGGTAAGDLRVLDRGTLGEFLLSHLLDPARSEEARQAAEGWAGDRYVTWSDGDRLRVALRVVTDSGADRDELVEALRAWADDHGSARVREEPRGAVVEASLPLSGTRRAGERPGRPAG